MNKNNLTIAIDGPAGAGKTTIAKALSRKLGIMYLSTGALYRAYAIKYIENNLDVNSCAVASDVANCTKIDVRYINGVQHTILDGVDVTTKLYQDQVSEVSSVVSKHQQIRLALQTIQKQIAKSQSVIMDGRDIGSVVLPLANYKFYLDADIEIRAKRRHNELVLRGDKIDYEEVLMDMKKRDFNDINRSISPLVKCKDSIVIDCTNLTVEQVVDEFLKYIKKEK